MNKQTFIEELQKGLNARGVAEIDDIVSDYEEHFARRAADGYSQEETARKLGDPRELALEYAAGLQAPARRAHWSAVPGVIALDLLVVLLLLAAYAWVAAIALASIALVLAGVVVAAAPLFPAAATLLPFMPPVPRVMIGVALAALGGLFFVLAANGFQLVRKAATAYFRWQKGVLTGRKTPPYAIYPLMGDRARRALRRLAVILLVLFITALSLAYIPMSAQAGSFEFWHIWGWFDGSAHG